jgi:hypothetical protein
MTENLRRLLCSTDAETWAFLTCYARLCRRIGATRRIWPLWYLADAKDAGIMRNLTQRGKRCAR